MKKTILLILALVMLFSVVLTGCGNKATEEILANMDREAPYTAELPSVVTSIDPEKDEVEEVLIGTVSGATGSVNVRSEPSTNGIIIGSAMPGERYLVTEEFAEETWHKIRYKGSVGFCYHRYNGYA